MVFVKVETCSDDETYAVNEDHVIGVKEGTHSIPGMSPARETDADVSSAHLFFFY
jgi:hypothetical protein